MAGEGPKETSSTISPPVQEGDATVLADVLAEPLATVERVVAVLEEQGRIFTAQEARRTIGTLRRAIVAGKSDDEAMVRRLWADTFRHLQKIFGRITSPRIQMFQTGKSLVLVVIYGDTSPPEPQDTLVKQAMQREFVQSLRETSLADAAQSQGRGEAFSCRETQ